MQPRWQGDECVNGECVAETDSVTIVVVILVIILLLGGLFYWKKKSKSSIQPTPMAANLTKDEVSSEVQMAANLTKDEVKGIASVMGIITGSGSKQFITYSGDKNTSRVEGKCTNNV